jgi:2-polyprenyl-6-methoxyphenol hydroxylase-like FAD-dependent oxidoreductase
MKTANRISTREHAIVIGASMAGLAAAAALAPHYERVTVLERDALPGGPGHRRGVPQSKHAHGLQPGGLHALEELLPGLTEELRAAGVPIGDLGERGSWTVGGSRAARGNAGVPGIGVTRPFLEHHVRARVCALRNVTILDRVDVLGLRSTDTATQSGVRVTGVDIVRADEGPDSLEAQLVVDASGKVSKLPAWLAGLGYPVPTEEFVHCKIAYVSRRWRLADDRRHDDIVRVITPAERPHFGVMIAQEDGSHIVTVGGLLDSGPARTDEAYLAFAASLPDPVISDALVGATPLTELRTAHFPASRRRRYDKLGAFPAGLLALGDSIASFNPMYGQGMTVAALEAVALRDMLARGPLDARRFFKQAHRIEDVAWKINAGGDLRYPDVVGRRTRDMAIMNRYLDRLTAAAAHDPQLIRQFLRVSGFVDGPQTLFKPSIVWRVLRRPRRRLLTIDAAAVASPAPA